MAKLGPDNISTAISIYIYTYIYAVKLKTGPRFGGFKVKLGPSLKLKIGPSFFIVYPIFTVFWGFLETRIVSHCAKIVFFLQSFGDVKNEVFEK